MTFLEQDKTKIKPTPDAGLPSKKDNTVACNIWPSWNFNSKTERERHYAFFHSRKQLTLSDKSVSTASKKEFTCNFLVNGKKCGLNFTSYRQLDKHKTAMLHKKAKKV